MFLFFDIVGSFKSSLIVFVFGNGTINGHAVDAIVVVSKSACNDLIRVLKELTTTIQLDFVTIPDDHDTGTIDTLRLIRNKITVCNL